MTSSARHPRLTFAEYLALERASGIKHEFLDGRTWAMAGGTIEHAQLAANIIRELGVQLRGRGCRVFTSDLRVRVAATGLATYPDVRCLRVDRGGCAKTNVTAGEILSFSSRCFRTARRRTIAARSLPTTAHPVAARLRIGVAERGPHRGVRSQRRWQLDAPRSSPARIGLHSRARLPARCSGCVRRSASLWIPITFG